MKLLITGGAGFIGSHLIDALLGRGHTVDCIDDLSLGKMENIEHHLSDKRFTFIKLDLLDIAALERFMTGKGYDCIFHLAANSDIAKGRESTRLDLERTFMTTFNVLDSMRKHNIKRIVFSSTSAVYGELDHVLSENTGPLFPISFYGAAKLASEGYITASCENFGMQAWICRFPNVVGERTTHGAVYDFITKLEKDPTKLVVLGNGTQRKPYTYVKDLVEGILFCWEHSNDKVNCFNLGVDDDLSVTRIAEIVINEMDLNAEIEYTGGDRGWVGDVPFFSYDLNKVNTLGWKAKHTSEEAMRIAVRTELARRAAGRTGHDAKIADVAPDNPLENRKWRK